MVFTGAGDRSFCTGGSTAEYAEYYAGRPGEYRQYMRLFNDMVTAILSCDKPVVNRVNGMRIGGGQEIGMACDFTLASDLAWSPARPAPQHGSAPDGGSTDFLHLYVGWGPGRRQLRAFAIQWSAHEALRLGLVNDIFPVLKVGWEVRPQPHRRHRSLPRRMGPAGAGTTGKRGRGVGSGQGAAALGRSTSPYSTPQSTHW